MSMSEVTINVSNLTRIYRVPVREAGVRAAFKSLFQRKHRIVNAVSSINFEIHAGEIVGFLGPNGAGKTTTLKMLSGLIYPTSGEVEVLGYVPWKRDKTFLSQLSLVMGQRNQLHWDIPVIDSFELNKVIYGIPNDTYHEILNELSGLMDITELLEKPVRNLSLGQRMKCEIVLSLLHRPSVLFLDEPTIGLDISAQRIIREFISNYNKRFSATIMVTSHNMADIEALCNRIILIHKGSILFDGPLQNLVRTFSEEKIVKVELKESTINLSIYGKVKKNIKGQIEVLIPKNKTAEIVEHLSKSVNVSDIEIKDPPIEDVIDRIFTQGFI